MVAAAVTLTRCRTAWLALAVAVVADLWPSPGRRLATITWLVAGVAFAVVMPTQLRWHERHPFAASGARLLSLREGSGALRVAQYDLVLREPHDWLRGWGPGSWHRVAAAADSELGRNYVPQSDYLRSFCDGGLPAALGLFGLYVAMLFWIEPTRRPFLFALALTSVGDVPLLRVECMLLMALACADARRPASTSL